MGSFLYELENKENNKIIYIMNMQLEGFEDNLMWYKSV